MFVKQRGTNQLIIIGVIITAAYLLLTWDRDSPKIHWDSRSIINIPSISFGSEEVAENVAIVDSNNQEMLQLIRAKHLTPPSTLEYNLTNPKLGNYDSHYMKIVFEIFGKSKTSGVFMEAGASDGETGSNTLQLEQMGWKGLLVECNPQALPKLMTKNRKAWIADVCLSTTGIASSVKFYSAPEWPASAQIDRQLSLDEMKVHGIDWMKNKTWVEYERPSFPLQAIVEAIGEFKEIDFLCLDVQGAEIGVLKNYPFHLFPIKLIILEILTFNAEQRNEIITLLFSNGYKFYKDIGADWVYVLKEYAPTQ